MWIFLCENERKTHVYKFTELMLITTFWEFSWIELASRVSSQSSKIMESSKKVEKMKGKTDSTLAAGLNKRASTFDSRCCFHCSHGKLILFSEANFRQCKWTTCLNAIPERRKWFYRKWKNKRRAYSLNLIYFLFVLILPCKPSHPSIHPFIQPANHSSIHPFIHLLWWAREKSKLQEFMYTTHTRTYTKALQISFLLER